MRTRLMPLLAGFFLLTLAAPAIAAEMVVVASTAPEFKSGWIVAAGSSNSDAGSMIYRFDS